MAHVHDKNPPSASACQKIERLVLIRACTWFQVGGIEQMWHRGGRQAAQRCGGGNAPAEPQDHHTEHEQRRVVSSKVIGLQATQLTSVLIPHFESPCGVVFSRAGLAYM